MGYARYRTDNSQPARLTGFGLLLKRGLLDFYIGGLVVYYGLTSYNPHLSVWKIKGHERTEITVEKVWTVKYLMNPNVLYF
ncbi:hypothetical protein ACLIBG_14780 [Virgibacillus sp. W0181]|uniref:hypothetical protein n=1 Tax=Virgibacillus sp. W0181 TaxID=3391581 RepID=UPI003F459314